MFHSVACLSRRKNGAEDSAEDGNDTLNTSGQRSEWFSGSFLGAFLNDHVHGGVPFQFPFGAGSCSASYPAAVLSAPARGASLAAAPATWGGPRRSCSGRSQRRTGLSRSGMEEEATAWSVPDPSGLSCERTLGWMLVKVKRQVKKTTPHPVSHK